jgi:hypothetical protein
LLLILVLPFIQILIQRLRRQVDERKTRVRIANNSLHNNPLDELNPSHLAHLADRTASGETFNDFRGLS